MGSLFMYMYIYDQNVYVRPKLVCASRWTLSVTQALDEGQKLLIKEIRAARPVVLWYFTAEMYFSVVTRMQNT